MPLSKRRRGVVGGLDGGGLRAEGPRSRKKGKAKMAATIRAMEIGGSRMTHHNPAARTPDTKMRVESEAVRRGAERLAPPSAQGVPPRFLQGPSVQQELRVTTAQEQQLWIEGSAQGETWWHLNSMTQQKEKEAGSVVDGELKAAEGNTSHVPKGIKKRYRALLRGTSTDWESGAIGELKCQLCPGANFSHWEEFKRHCNTMEAHPLKILFCRYCGDFFARPDSLERHQKNRPPECFDVTPAEAETKSRETMRVHEVFKERLERCLKTNEEIGTPFAQIIKEMYPKSSKRGSRQQSRLKARMEEVLRR
jgi:hypothetical protein